MAAVVEPVHRGHTERKLSFSPLRADGFGDERDLVLDPTQNQFRRRKLCRPKRAMPMRPRPRSVSVVGSATSANVSAP